MFCMLRAFSLPFTGCWLSLCLRLFSEVCCCIIEMDRAAQLTNLRKEFPDTTCVKETSADTLLKVDHDYTISPGKTYGLTLYVKLGQSFPRVAPSVTLPYCFRPVPITPPDVRATELDAYKWDPLGSSLAEAVRNAFQHAAARWGPVEPPTMNNVLPLLAAETDRLLQDLVENSNCLEAYCYQFPIIKKMREAAEQTVDEVEKVANENIKLRAEVEGLQVSVESMQKALQQQVDALQQLGGNTLLTSVCTPQALLQTLEEDVRRLNEERSAVGKKATSAYHTDRRAFQETLEQYKGISRTMHLLDLKCRAYRTQIS